MWYKTSITSFLDLQKLWYVGVITGCKTAKKPSAGTFFDRLWKYPNFSHRRNHSWQLSNQVNLYFNYCKIIFVQQYFKQYLNHQLSDFRFYQVLHCIGILLNILHNTLIWRIRHDILTFNNNSQLYIQKEHTMPKIKQKNITLGTIPAFQNMCRTHRIH